MMAKYARSDDYASYLHHSLNVQRDALELCSGHRQEYEIANHERVEMQAKIERLTEELRQMSGEFDEEVTMLKATVHDRDRKIATDEAFVNESHRVVKLRIKETK